jgi:hypothetical protein
MISRSVWPNVAARIASTRWVNAARLAPPLPPTAPTLCQRLRPLARAASCSCSIVRAPMPRAGKLTTRRKLVSSFAFSISRRYASACLTSARSKKRKPP